MLSDSKQIGTEPVSSKDKATTTVSTKDSSKVITNVQTARPTTTIKLATIGSWVRQNTASIIILIVGISILIFASVMITILVITLTNHTKEDEKPDVIPDPCVDKNRNCYKPDCDYPYVAAKETSVGGVPCVPVQAPYLRDFNGKICIKGDFPIPWCYVTSRPPFRRQPCYKFCGEPTDCIDRYEGCYHANRSDCNGHHYAYNKVLGHFASLIHDIATPCSNRHGHEPFCMLMNATAPWCYNDSGDKQFCYPSCRAVQYLRKTSRSYNAVWVYGGYKYIFLARRKGDKWIGGFRGTNAEDCATLCLWTRNCFFYSSTNDGEGKCNLFATSGFDWKTYQNGTYGWIGRNDTIVFYGGKVSQEGDGLMTFENYVMSLRFDENEAKWLKANRKSHKKKQLNPITASSQGIFYAINWKKNDYGWKYIEDYNHRGYLGYLFRYRKPPILYGAILGINNVLFMCGGLMVDHEIHEDAVRDCAIYDPDNYRFDNSSEYYYESLSGNLSGTPARMLEPRVHHFLVHYEGFIFAFMGCQKRIENCKEMVKPIHYFSIKENKWRISGTSMQIERLYYGHAVYKDSVYFCGGVTVNRTEILDSCEVYHFATPLKQNGTTTTFRSLPSKTRDLAMAVIGDMMLAIGGRHSNDEKNVSNAILRFHDRNKSWTLFWKMKQRRYGMGVAVI